MNVLGCVLAELIELVLQDPATTNPAHGPMPVPVAFACRRGDRAIEVDGSLVDWPLLPALRLDDPRQLSGTHNMAWRSADDLSAFAFLLWDQEDLWFAATVKDEWHRALDPQSIMLLETPVADSIVLSFDPRRDTRSLGPDPGRQDDAEFWLSEEASHEIMRWDRLRGSARVLEKGRVVVSHDREKGVTTYEAQLPWSEVLLRGQQPAAGTVFDLQVVLNDFDESTDPLPQTRIGWTFGCGVVADAALFGSVMLLDDDGALAAGLPQVPERPAVPIAPHLEPRWWRELGEGLRRQPPALHDGSSSPEAAGGIDRLLLLQRLDYEIGRYPRVDFVEYCQRQQRRMAREVGAQEQHGLPAYWAMIGAPVSLAIEAPVPSGTARLFRLPQSGWIVRGERQSFAVDAAGSDVATTFRSACDFAIVSQPLDMTRRNDQLLLQMTAATPARQFLTHIAFHLPKLMMSDMPLIEPGTSRLQSDGARVQALGRVTDDGTVPYAIGYRVELPGRVSLLFAGPALRVVDLPPERCDALVLTPRNPEALDIARVLAPPLIVIDDAFRCFHLPNTGRIDLRMAHAMQKALLPLRSVLLAPGESWDITSRQ